jgi:lysophospholipase L1-like esterase
MKQVLVYGDSLSWGIIPESRNRFRFEERWPGRLEIRLNELGCRSRVVEDCLNGRRTVWDDPIKPGRKGIEGLAQRIEANSPLDLVILLLGTNDFQSMHQNQALDSANGIGDLITEIRSAPIEPTMTHPEVLVVAPPVIQKARGAIAEKFADAENKAIGLNQAIEAIAKKHACHFFDAASVTQTSRVDGVHLDLDQHAALGQRLGPAVKGILESGGIDQSL